jgi:hypothetical protein
MLLMVVKGATNYGDICTYNGIVHQTFKEACVARGLLCDDKEWYNIFESCKLGSSVTIKKFICYNTNVL